MKVFVQWINLLLLLLLLFQPLSLNSFYIFALNKRLDSIQKKLTITWTAMFPELIAIFFKLVMHFCHQPSKSFTIDKYKYTERKSLNSLVYISFIVSIINRIYTLKLQTVSSIYKSWISFIDFTFKEFFFLIFLNIQKITINGKLAHPILK